MKPLTPEMIKFIKKMKQGFMADVHPDGNPGLSHRGTFTVFDDHHLAFAGLDSPKTLASQGQDRQVVVEIVDYRTQKGYRFRGHVHAFSTRGVNPFLAFYENRNKGRINNSELIRVESSEEVFSLAYSLCASGGDVVNWKMNFNNLWKF